MGRCVICKRLVWKTGAGQRAMDEAPHPSAPPTFADLLRHHRVAAALSQEALAEQAGLSVRAISDLERGVKSQPYLETVRLLADALNLTLPQRAALAAAARPTSDGDRAPHYVGGKAGHRRRVASPAHAAGRPRVRCRQPRQPDARMEGSAC